MAMTKKPKDEKVKQTAPAASKAKPMATKPATPPSSSAQRPAPTAPKR